MFNELYKMQMEIFGLAHIITLAVCLGISALMSVFARRIAGGKIADKVFRYCIAGVIITLETGYHIFQAVKGTWTVGGGIPLHLCALTAWLTAVAMILDYKPLLKITFFWSVIGATLSLTVVDMDYSFPHYRFFHYFGVHFLFLLGNLYYVISGKIKLYYKDVIRASIALTSIAFVLFWVNIIFDQNYMFLREFPSEVSFITEVFGWPGYVPVWVLTVFFTFNLDYFVVYLLSKRKWKSYFKRPPAHS